MKHFNLCPTQQNSLLWSTGNNTLHYITLSLPYAIKTYSSLAMLPSKQVIRKMRKKKYICIYMPVEVVISWSSEIWKRNSVTLPRCVWSFIGCPFALGIIWKLCFSQRGLYVIVVHNWSYLYYIWNKLLFAIDQQNSPKLSITQVLLNLVITPLMSLP